MATSKTTTKAQSYTGKVTKVELRSFPARDSGRYGREVNDVKVLVAFRDEAGEERWFYSPATRQSISTSGPYTVATLEPSDWITSERWSCEGFAGARGFGSTPTPRVKVGDTIRIRARVKGPSRFGEQLWYVQREDFSLSAIRMAYDARMKAAMAAHKGEIPGRIEFPPVPHGVMPHEEQQAKARSYLPTLPPGWEWKVYGGPHGLYFADAELTNAAAFLAWHEGRPVEECQAPEQ